MDDSIHVVPICGKKSILKPPISEKLRAGSVELKPGEEVGEHKTEDREELIVILEGKAIVICEDEQVEVSANNAVYIPKDKTHNVLNKSDNILRYVYVITPLSENNPQSHTHGSARHSH